MGGLRLKECNVIIWASWSDCPLIIELTEYCPTLVISVKILSIAVADLC
jgi:hypothetical protein